jgi:hypothetical protein
MQSTLEAAKARHTAAARTAAEQTATLTTELEKSKVRLVIFIANNWTCNVPRNWWSKSI